MKYIILEVGTQEMPILFSEYIQHIDMASMFSNKVLAAGFVEIYKPTNKLRCFGYSEGLQISSRLKDTEIVNENLVPWSIEDKFKVARMKAGK